MSQTGLNCYMRYLNGENNALEEFVSTYSDALIRYAYCYVQDAALAEDVMEETIATLLFHRKHFSNENHMQAYLYRVVRNKSIDHLRKRKREVSLTDVEEVLYGNDVENQVILDVNVGITSRMFFTQKSCMGLFPKYLHLKENGGNYYGALNQDKLLGAVMSVKPTELGMRADFFSCQSFENSLPELIKKCKSDYGKIYFQIANADQRKAELISELGFSPKKEILHSFEDNCLIPMTIFEE